MSSDLFRDPLTFLEQPRSTEFVDADVAILGIPFDCSRDQTRFGSRMGPNAVRHASVLTRELMQDAGGATAILAASLLAECLGVLSQ